jgi:hypothetical protein
MAAPSLIDSQKTSYDSSPAGLTKTVVVSWQAGDVIVWCAQGENFVTATGGALVPSASGLTFNEQQLVAVDTYSYVRVMTAVAASSGSSVTVTTTASGGFDPNISGWWWGSEVKVWRSSDGVGASAKANVASGAPSLDLTTTQADSAICVYNNDWNAQDGTSRVWRTNAGAFTESNYYRDASHHTAYSGSHANAGAIGTYATGLSAPTGQKYSIIALEIKGTAGGQTIAVPLKSVTVAKFPTSVSTVGPGYIVQEDHTDPLPCFILLEDGTSYLVTEAGEPAASGITVNAPLKAVNLARFAPLTPRVTAPPVKAVTVTKFAPEMGAAIIVAVPLKALSVAKFAPATPRVTAPPVKALSVAKLAPRTPRVTAPPVKAISVAKLVPLTPRVTAPPLKAVSVAKLAPATPRVTAVPVKGVVVGKPAPAMGQTIVVQVPVKAVTLTALAPSTPRVTSLATKAVTLTRFAPATPRVTTVPVKGISVAKPVPQMGQNVLIAIPVKGIVFSKLTPTTPRLVTVPVKSTVVTKAAPTVVISNNQIIAVPLKQVQLGKLAPLWSTNIWVQIPVKQVGVQLYAPTISGAAAGTIDGAFRKIINIDYGAVRLYNMNATGAYGTLPWDI